MKIYLASKSPRRLEILRNMGIEPVVCVSDADEDIDISDPAEAVRELALRKAEAVRDMIPYGALCIAADTVVYSEGEILGKPSDDADAARMLAMMSGKTHTVYTGAAVAFNGKTVCGAECTEVDFRTLSDEEISSYVGSGEPRDKAGAYAIQGGGAYFVRRIRGDYLNVIGLPVCLIAEMAKSAFGIDLYSDEHKS